MSNVNTSVDTCLDIIIIIVCMILLNMLTTEQSVFLINIHEEKYFSGNIQRLIVIAGRIDINIMTIIDDILHHPSQPCNTDATLFNIQHLNSLMKVMQSDHIRKIAGECFTSLNPPLKLCKSFY